MKRRIRSLLLVTCATSITAAAVAAPVRWAANGHFYQAVRVGTPISWKAANGAAQKLGPGWHLATITSAEEDAFVRSLFATNPVFFNLALFPDDSRLGPWIGGYQVFGANTFQWVTGEPVSFTSWISPPSRRGLSISYVDYSRPWGDGKYIGWVPWPAFSYSPIAYIAELSVVPASPGLELKQFTVAGCKAVTGRVNISAPAPPEGLVVNLSDTLSSASTPASLKIPAGATSKFFSITTTPVASSQTGTISATFGGKTFSRQLTVRPIGLQSLALSAPTVVGGTKVIGTARLDCEAALGPVTVRLGSSNPAIASPVAASIVIPQGLQSETFDVTTSAVGYQRSVWIFGTASKLTKSKLLKLTP
jgi:hypothetical protein